MNTTPKVTARVEIELTPSKFMKYVEGFIEKSETWGWFGEVHAARLESLARFIRDTQQELKEARGVKV